MTEVCGSPLSFYMQEAAELRAELAQIEEALAPPSGGEDGQR